MKKTNFFLLFVIAFITSISLPNDIFADDTTGFIFSEVLIAISLLMYAIALYHNTENLMKTPLGDNNDPKVVHFLRFEAVVILILTLSNLAVLLYKREHFGESEFSAAASNYYQHSFYSVILLLISTVLGIFISNDIERKKEKPQKATEE